MIKQRLDIEAVLESGRRGQFDVIADTETIASRGGNWFTHLLGAGWPDPEGVIAKLEERQARGAASG